MYLPNSGQKIFGRPEVSPERQFNIPDSSLDSTSAGLRRISEQRSEAQRYAQQRFNQLKLQNEYDAKMREQSPKTSQPEQKNYGYTPTRQELNTRRGMEAQEKTGAPAINNAQMLAGLRMRGFQQNLLDQAVANVSPMFRGEWDYMPNSRREPVLIAEYKRLMAAAGGNKSEYDQMVNVVGQGNMPATPWYTGS